MDSDILSLEKGMALQIIKIQSKIITVYFSINFGFPKMYRD